MAAGGRLQRVCRNADVVMWAAAAVLLTSLGFPYDPRRANPDMECALALAEEYAQRPAREETINDPTNPKHYWRFRLHARLEDLAQNAAWLGDIRQLVGESGRDPEGSGAKAPRF